MAPASHPRFVVIGAGASGLAAANRLVELQTRAQRPLSLSVLEASGKAGGVVSTRKENGFLWEEGPDSFITDKPWALDLCRRLGLEGELTGTNPHFQRSFVAWRGRLHPTPEGFYLLAPSRLWPFVTTRLFSWPGKARMALDFVLPRADGDTEESLGAFVRRRFGREALERMAQPMVAGVYAADPEELSLKATFPRFLEMEKEYRSVVLALWMRRRRGTGFSAGMSGPRYSLFTTLRQGLSGLVEALVSRLPPQSLRLNSPVENIRREEGGWRLTLRTGERLSADGIVLAVPGWEAARLLAPLDKGLADVLRTIPYHASATVHLAYRRSDVAHPLDGFGFVAPAVEKRPYIGCTFSHVKFPGRAPEGTALLRAFIGGKGQEGVMALSDDKLVETVQGDLAELLGIRGKSLAAALKRHPASMCQYTLGHLERVESIENKITAHPGLALAGNATRGIGLPDCIRSGEAAAAALWKNIPDATH